MKLQRKRIQERGGLKLAGLLREMGVTPSLPYRGTSLKGFNTARATWSQLHDYYDAARSSYRARLARCHPDRGGEHVEAVTINRLWKQIRERFNRHGIPAK